MKASSRGARFAPHSWRIVAIFLCLASTQAVFGEEYADVFEVSTLSSYEEPAELDPADPSACLDEMEQACLEQPCECYGYSDGGGASLTAELEAIARNMASQGVIYQVVVPQFYQGVARGGAEQEFEYGGKVDQFFILDGGKLWGWEGFSVNMHVETRYGEDVNREAVGLAPVNIAMLMPNADEHDTAITNLTFTQALSEEWLVTFGKFNSLDLWQSLYPQTGRGVDGFMNASMVFPLGAARVVPLSYMGVGVTKLYEGKPQAGLTVFDNQDVSTTSGFDNMFQNGANILAFYRHYHEVEGLPGSQLFGGVWATGEYVSFDPLSFVILPGQGIVVDREGGAYTLLYILEQTLWADACNETRNVGLLSQWTLSDPDTSPFHWTCNVAIQAQGMNRTRPQDTIGVGYFHSDLSNSFVNALSPPFDLGNVDGVELYYKAPMSECFVVTADLQVIEPAEQQLNTALVVGVRGMLGF